MTSRDADFERFCKSWLNFLLMRQSFVDSDPRSPECFHVEPDLDDLVDLINTKFEIDLQLYG